MTPGFRFKEGRLFIFTEEEAVTIEGWPQLKPFRTVVASGVRSPFVPQFRLLRPAKTASRLKDLGPEKISSRSVDPELERVTAFRGFRYTMPPEVAAACERFPGRQWRVLQLCSLREEAVELVYHNPVLGFCLAHRLSLQTRPAGTKSMVKSMAARKRREILEWLEFPPTDSVVKIFGKIVPESLDLDRIKSLRVALKQAEVLRLLAHLPRITAGVQALVSDPLVRNSISPKLLSEVAETEREDDEPETAHLLSRLCDLWRELNPRRPLRKFDSLARIREAHQELVGQLNQRQKEAATDVKLPLPPLPGNDSIMPLVTTGELAEEGREQSNCVRSYANWVLAGEGYIYRVLQPERATLAITRGPDGCWRVSELKTKANNAPSPETVKSVEEWLRRYSFSA